MLDIKVFYEVTENGKTWECETMCTCESVQDAINFQKQEFEGLEDNRTYKVLEDKTIERFAIDFE